ncbi:MAG: DNA polymerase III subunit chi [Alphaproteobacteria bacterium]|nr:DNA polymerase III subunit chi [Alphaproteobacteria bacterium]
MAELWVYHLERAGLEEVLPELLEKTRARGWRAVVRVGSPERLAALDSHLWTYRDTSFLPHGGPGQGDPARQPVYLTTEEDVPNGAEVLFLTDGVEVPQTGLEAFARVILIFDGRDEAALSAARAAWRRAREGGISVSYWKQGAKGWEKAG